MEARESRRPNPETWTGEAGLSEGRGEPQGGAAHLLPQMVPHADHRLPVQACVRGHQHLGAEIRHCSGLLPGIFQGHAGPRDASPTLTNLKRAPGVPAPPPPHRLFCLLPGSLLPPLSLTLPSTLPLSGSLSPHLHSPQTPLQAHLKGEPQFLHHSLHLGLELLCRQLPAPDGHLVGEDHQLGSTRMLPGTLYPGPRPAPWPGHRAQKHTHLVALSGQFPELTRNLEVQDPRVDGNVAR